MNNPPEKFKGKYRIQSNRLKGYDYSSEGAYFITICAKDRECLFGEIINEKIVLNDLGKIAFDEWQKTEKIRQNILIDEFVIMPNHLHGILIVNKKILPSKKCISVNTNCTVETNCNLSLQSQQPQKQHGTSQTIGSIVRGVKIGITKYARKNTNIHIVWQPNYYDRIIRNEDELNRIREYILQNPAKWKNDRNNTENIFM